METQSEQLAARQHALVLRCEDVLWRLGVTKEEVSNMAKKYSIDLKKGPQLKASEG